jgi:hypothetical protein
MELMPQQELVVVAAAVPIMQDLVIVLVLVVMVRLVLSWSGIQLHNNIIMNEKDFVMSTCL